MLDTNICIYVINGRRADVVSRFAQHPVGELGISTVTLAELAHGAARSQSPRSRESLERFLTPLVIADFDEAAAWQFGEVCAILRRAGTPIGPLDTQIAAHALALDCTLVTNNQREFQRVPELRVENWIP